MRPNFFLPLESNFAGFFTQGQGSVHWRRTGDAAVRYTRLPSTDETCLRWSGTPSRPDHEKLSTCKISRHHSFSSRPRTRCTPCHSRESRGILLVLLWQGVQREIFAEEKRSDGGFFYTCSACRNQDHSTCQITVNKHGEKIWRFNLVVLMSPKLSGKNEIAAEIRRIRSEKPKGSYEELGHALVCCRSLWTTCLPMI